MLSKRFGESIAKIDAKIAAGELDLSLSVREREGIDQNLAIEQRKQMLLSFARPASSDKSPVKVSFLSDTAEDALPGWMRKMERPAQLGTDEIGSSPAYSAIDGDDERADYEEVRGGPVRPDVPVSPSDLPDRLKPVSPQSVTDIEKQLTPQGIEVELTEGIPTVPADKVQQLIDEYGTEEGLRRLREMDPEAARQFERERSPKPPRDVSDGEASER